MQVAQFTPDAEYWAMSYRGETHERVVELGTK